MAPSMSSAPSNPSDPIFLVEVLRAHPGQCVLVHVGTVADPRLILVDGGPPDTWERELKPRLEELRLERGGILEIDAVISTRPDSDFIGGLEGFFSSTIKNPPMPKQEFNDVANYYIIDGIYVTINTHKIIYKYFKSNKNAMNNLVFVGSVNKNANYNINNYSVISFFSDSASGSLGNVSVKITQGETSSLIGTGRAFAQGFGGGKHKYDFVATRSFDLLPSDAIYRVAAHKNKQNYQKPSIVFTDNLVDNVGKKAAILRIRQFDDSCEFEFVMLLYAHGSNKIVMIKNKEINEITIIRFMFDAIRKKLASGQKITFSPPNDQGLDDYVMTVEDSKLLEMARIMVVEGLLQPQALVQPSRQDFHTMAINKSTGKDVVDPLKTLFGPVRRQTDAPSPLWQAWLQEFHPETITRIRECLADALIRRSDPPAQ